MEPEVVADRKTGGRLLLPTPILVAQEISLVPEGSLITAGALRTRMARKFGADHACPLMTGIFLNIVAGAAEEQIAAAEPPIAPYWRVVRDDGSLSPKTPDGPQRQADRLRDEGHTVELKRNKWWVPGFASRLVTP